MKDRFSADLSEKAQKQMARKVFLEREPRRLSWVGMTREQQLRELERRYNQATRWSEDTQ